MKKIIFTTTLFLFGVSLFSFELNLTKLNGEWLSVKDEKVYVFKVENHGRSGVIEIYNKEGKLEEFWPFIYAGEEYIYFNRVIKGKAVLYEYSVVVGYEFKFIKLYDNYNSNRYIHLEKRK